MLLTADVPSSFALVASKASDSGSAFDVWSEPASPHKNAGNLPLALINIHRSDVRYSIQSNQLDNNFMASWQCFGTSDFDFFYLEDE